MNTSFFTEMLFEDLSNDFERAYDYAVDDFSNGYYCDVCLMEEKNIMDLAFFREYRLCHECYHDNNIISKLIENDRFFKEVSKVEKDYKKLGDMKVDFTNACFESLRIEKHGHDKTKVLQQSLAKKINEDGERKF